MAERPELPLFTWAAARRPPHGQGRRRRRSTAIALVLGSCGLLIAPLFRQPVPRLIWNASASAPIGLYRVAPAGSLARGDMVIAWPSHAMRGLAAARHYVPANVPLVKRVAGLAGDRICAAGSWIRIRPGDRVSRLRRDSLGRRLPWWNGCLTLGPGQLFLLMPGVRDSFDGRYFGPTAPGDVIGRATPIWLR